MIKETTSILDIDLSLIDESILKETLKELQVKYLNSFMNIELYNYLIEFMENEKKTESEEAQKSLDIQIENQRQQKLATIKILANHERSIKILKNLLSN